MKQPSFDHQWKSYLREVYGNIQLHESQHKQIQQAFLGGAYSVAMTAVAVQHLDPEQACEILTKYIKEVYAKMHELAGIKPGVGKN